jgi:hypothetical protein
MVDGRWLAFGNNDDGMNELGKLRFFNSLNICAITKLSKYQSNETFSLVSFNRILLHFQSFNLQITIPQETM